MNKQLHWNYFPKHGTGDHEDDLRIAKQAMARRGYMGGPFQVGHEEGYTVLRGSIGLLWSEDDWENSADELNKFDAELSVAGYFRA